MNKKRIVCAVFPVFMFFSSIALSENSPKSGISKSNQQILLTDEQEKKLGDLIIRQHGSYTNVKTMSWVYLDLSECASESLKNVLISYFKERYKVYSKAEEIPIDNLTKPIAYKPRLLEIESIKGTILDPDNKDGIWEHNSSTQVYLKSNIDLKEEEIRRITKGDFDKFWAIIRQGKQLRSWIDGFSFSLKTEFIDNKTVKIELKESLNSGFGDRRVKTSYDWDDKAGVWAGANEVEESIS